MHRQSPQSLRHRTRGYLVATEFVQRIADQWRRGLPTRLARKVLRKKGIHPWSLLVPLEARDWSRMIQELEVPRWLVDASLDPHQMPYEGGMAFWNLPVNVRLPEGLVLPHFNLFAAPGVKRLPRRVWTYDVTLMHCPALQALPCWSGRPGDLNIWNCPQLTTIPQEMGPMNHFFLRGCEQLVDIPPLAPLQNLYNRVMLKDLPRLVRIGIRGCVQNLTVWNCPSLRGLDGFTVTEVIEVDRCPSLTSLPGTVVGIQGHIRDCLALASLDRIEIMPADRGLVKYQPYRGACQLPPARPMPSVQVVEARPLFPPAVMEEDPSWTWPPRPRAQQGSSIDLTLRTLGLSPLDRIRCLAKSGTSLDKVIGRAIDHEESPARALELVLASLGEALKGGDREAAEVLLRQADQAGLGLLSLWIALAIPERETIVNLVPACRTLYPLLATSLESFSESLGGIRGSLIINTHTDLGPGFGPRNLGERLWVEGDLTINDCSELEALPDLLIVQGDLWVSRCPALRHFPKRLEVSGDLAIDELPRLERSLCRASVGGYTSVSSAPGLEIIQLGSWET